jgi:hypothetical protein
LKLENLGITGGAEEDIAEWQCNSRERVVDVVFVHSVAVRVFLRQRRLVVAAIEIGEIGNAEIDPDRRQISTPRKMKETTHTPDI